MDWDFTHPPRWLRAVRSGTISQIGRRCQEATEEGSGNATSCDSRDTEFAGKFGKKRIFPDGTRVSWDVEMIPLRGVVAKIDVRVENGSFRVDEVRLRHSNKKRMTPVLERMGVIAFQKSEGSAAYFNTTIFRLFISFPDRSR